jgi:protein-S-isoprenylcysteine O-methyltransferase Ste14
MNKPFRNTRKPLRELVARRARDERYRTLLNRYLWPWLGGLSLVVVVIAVTAVQLAGSLPAPLLVALCALFVSGLALGLQRAQRRARREVAEADDLEEYEPPEETL